MSDTRALGARPDPVAIDPAATQAERRQLTVMFCDVVGSTALSARLDPEDMRDVIGAYHQLVGDIVGRRGGFVAQYLGDGALVYFGYPKAEEHDAENAVRTALAILQAVPELDLPSGPLQVRLGIATGLVVVGDLLKSGNNAQERGVVGQTPNLAARLQAAAAPGSIVIDAATRRLIGGLFEYAELRDLLTKGLDPHVTAWQVLRESGVASRFEALRESELPLVGRQDELAALRHRWDGLAGGKGGVVLLTGEAGIGKSRLIVALGEAAATGPRLELRYFCAPHHANSALFPIIRHFERAAGFEHSDSAEERVTRLLRYLAPAALSEEEIAVIAQLLSLPHDKFSWPAQVLSAEQNKDRLLDALLRWQERLAAGRPILVVLEDAHWIDPTSNQLLDLMVQRAGTSPMLLTVSGRPEFEPSWAELGHVTHLRLDRLVRHDGAALVRAMAGGILLDDTVVADILDRADGMPLFVEELTRSVLEQEGSSAAGAANVVPMTLHASLNARLDRLRPEARLVAQAGAAIGREFSRLLLGLAGVQSETLEIGLTQLVEGGLLAPQGGPGIADIYVFKHALVQDAAYATMLRGPRRALHARIAQALRDTLFDTATAQPELLARHFAEAGMISEALHYWQSAVEHSLARAATAEAVVQARAAIRLLDALPDSAERRTQSIDLYLLLGRALRLAKGIAAHETVEAYRAAHRQSLAEDDQQRLPEAHFGVLLGHYNRAELREADMLAAELQALGRRSGNQLALLRGHQMRGMTLFALGRFGAALDELESAIAAASAAASSDASSNAARYIPNAYIYQALSLLALGLPERGRARLDMGMVAAAEASPIEAGHALSNACYFHQLQGNIGTLREQGEAVITAARTSGIPTLLPQGHLYVAWALAQHGEPEQGLQLVRDYFLGQAVGDRFIEMPYAISLIADIHLRAGHPGRALELLDEALAMVEHTEERWFEPEMLRMRGECLLAFPQPRVVEAAECFEQALDLASRQGALLWELRAATASVALSVRLGRAGDVNRLAKILACFTEGFESADLRRARELLNAD